MHLKDQAGQPAYCSARSTASRSTLGMTLISPAFMIKICWTLCIIFGFKRRSLFSESAAQAFFEADGFVIPFLLGGLLVHPLHFLNAQNVVHGERRIFG